MFYNLFEFDFLNLVLLLFKILIIKFCQKNYVIASLYTMMIEFYTGLSLQKGSLNSPKLHKFIEKY